MTMNHLEGQSRPYLYSDDYLTHVRIQQIISTIALLVLGYYALSFFDVWPSTSKRRLYELSIRFIPSQLIYLLQYAMMRFGRFSDQDRLFRREDFGNYKAKQEALHQIVGNSPIPTVLQRARTLSGYDRILPKSKETGPPGLGNWDNSCYQNSVLQGLASLPAFQAYVHRSLLLCERTRVSANTTAALTAFIDQLSDASCHKQTVWTPKVLKSMDSWNQQDAQEYFSRILEAIEKEAILYTKVIGRSTYTGLACLQTKGPKSDFNQEKAVRKLLQTLISNPMDGMFAQALTCQTCGFSEGVTLTQFNCLTLNLGLGGARSITTLLDEYTQSEHIEGVECDNCTRIANKKSLPDGEDPAEIEDEKDSKKKVKKELRVKAKQITFGRLPKDLIMHINRSIWDDYGNQIKNPSFVQFPLRLSFSDRWCAPLEANVNPIQAIYELKCIVTHSGRHDNGHYVAYGKRDKDWYCFNDEIVTKLAEEQVLTRGNVFMLFYEAVETNEALDDEESSSQLGVDNRESAESSSITSAESESYDEPMMEPTQVSLPVMQTSSGEALMTDEAKPIGLPFVPAV